MLISHRKILQLVFPSTNLRITMHRAAVNSCPQVFAQTFHSTCFQCLFWLFVPAVPVSAAQLLCSLHLCLCCGCNYVIHGLFGNDVFGPHMEKVKHTCRSGSWRRRVAAWWAEHCSYSTAGVANPLRPPATLACPQSLR